MKDRITLIYPPATLPTSPYSSLPYLRGGLERFGIDVRCLDLNAEAYDYWLSSKFNAQASESCNINWAKSFFKKSEQDLLDKEKYSAAKQCLDSYFKEINKGIKGKSLTIGGYVISDFKLSGKSILNLAADVFDPLTSFYTTYFHHNEVQDKVIGISVTYDFQLIPALLLACFIKHYNQHAHIIMGGASIQYLKGFFMGNPWVFDWVDVITTSNGISELVSVLEGRTPSRSLLRNGSGVIETLDNDGPYASPVTPSPNYSGLSVDKYLSPRLTGIVMASEGCYYGKCAFCVPSKGKSFKYHQLPKENVISAINNVQKGLNTDLVFFGDDSIDSLHISDILSHIDYPIFWQGEFRAEPRLSDDLLRQFKKDGCLQILLGLESSSERVRNLMHKGIKQEDIIRILESCKINDIRVNVQTIIGFPGETMEESYGTARFIYNHRDEINSFAMSPFTLYKGSDVYNNPDKYRIDLQTQDFICDYSPLEGISNEKKLKLSKYYFSGLCSCFPANSFFIDGPMGNHAMIYYKHNISV